MATVEKNRSDDWKDKYFKALNELDDQERLRAEKVTRVSRDLLTVLQHFRGSGAAFDKDLAELQKTDKLADDIQQSRLRSLVSTLARMEPPAVGAAPAPSAKPSLVAVSAPLPLDSAAPLRELVGLLKVPNRLRPVIDDLSRRLGASADADLPLIGAIAEQLSVILGEAGEDRTLAARDVLQALIDHLSLPSAAQARLGAITPQLQKAVDSAAVKAIAKELADFVVDYVAGLHTEVSGLNTFLMVIKARLGEVSGFVDLEKSERKVASSARDDLNKSVQQSLDTMRGRVNTTDDLKQLKDDIQRQIGIIDGNLNAFMKSEGARSERVDEQHGTLAKQLEELGRETDRLRKQLVEAQDQALHDTLTGLPNRLAYNERMNMEYARWERSGQHLSLVVLDIDRFKSINDTFGHQAGDRVLKYLARELSSQIRAQDFFGRYGGEEFVLILPDTHRGGALKLADNLRRHIEACRFKFKDQPVAVTISCGIAEFAPKEAPAHAFDRADACLYAAKNNGRNRCEVSAG
ncbi:MAG: diguanylate cyclase [Proteobacteria bacterium]|nr:diguanylate cyclase [Pseudomonadota bacterium]